MKLKEFSATKHFSMHFKRIFGANTTFGDIAKVKYECPICLGSGSVVESPEGTTCKKYIICEDCNGTGKISKVKAQQNSTGNLMGSHVESHIKNQQEYKAKQLKEKL